MRPVLEIKNLCIERGGTTILDGVSWRIEPRQHWVVLGSNGSGKTSLLRALTGYLMPTDGSITVLGKRYGESDWRELRRAIGIISTALMQMIQDQETALDVVIGGKYAMINFWGEPKPAERRMALQLLHSVECGHLAERPWQVLSQGERQRVLIARALMAGPRLLILDEPCSGLDPVARGHFLQFLQRQGKRKDSPSLVLVTHHVEEIMPAFTHALVLKKGRVLGSGKKQRVLKSGLLSTAFGAAITLSSNAGHYHLSLRNSVRSVT
jgi:iron complex transport system ATP-binding protein